MPHPGDGLDELSLAVALDAGNAVDLAGAHREVHVVACDEASLVGHHQVVDLEPRSAHLGRFLVDLEGDVTTDHEVGERLGRRLLRIG